MAYSIALIENGVQIDWIDPALEVKQTETHWEINNGYHIYEWEKKDNRLISMELRNYVGESE